ncbi:unnamed protein product [Spirodela intermedia]|uniref:C2H2-type domain-containing protein n=1 Tax=Spirodela intermedia TaxID=51605 RepID=A0A7I8KRL2_SPIIN|nr:unnamed protein product [Spirodela intermedia]
MSDLIPDGFFPVQGDRQSPPPPAPSSTDGPSATPSGSAPQGQEENRVVTASQEGRPIGLASPSTPKFKKKPDRSAATITAPCSECGKRFWSQKALFGHMRCHPDRQWRGINPPPHIRRLQPSLEVPSSPTPRTRPLQGTHRRFQDLEHEVASYLVMLSNGPPRAEAANSSAGTRLGHKMFSGSLVGQGGFNMARRRGKDERGTFGYSSDDRFTEKSFSLSREQGSVEHPRSRPDEQGGCPPSPRRHVPDLNFPPPHDNNDHFLKPFPKST